ncbi:MAG: 4-hydroxy-3-methylbut-2-enyl diphosphate reductase [Rhodobacteraceae bacterium]|nr:MAG: 4-hydroxy-3-methylbut-2-enyl diphosphate reductase [Paracoccaceae bacterium]
MMKPDLNILLAAPRGFCAGVDRAIEMVELALKKWGQPIYVRHEIVHNKYVVESLKNKGAIFVEDVNDCPDDRPIIFSAHGVAKSVLSEAKRRNMVFLDATCPLVSKVHLEAERHSQRGLQIIMIGHEGHPETVGTMGQLPHGEILLVETVNDVKKVKPKDESKLAYITQTTLSLDDTAGIVDALLDRFPTIVGPHKEDICYATTNRQNAVKAIAKRIDGLLVVGSPNSSNSQRLVEVGRKGGCDYSQLIETDKEIDWGAINQMKSVGITAGASAPEILINNVLKSFKRRYNVTIETVESATEKVTFKVPKILRNTA